MKNWFKGSTGFEAISIGIRGWKIFFKVIYCIVAIQVLVIGCGVENGCNGKVVQSLSDQNRELKSGCKGNSVLNDWDLQFKLKSWRKGNFGIALSGRKRAAICAQCIA